MVTPHFFPEMGGIETHVYEVARRAVRRGLKVTVLTTDASGHLPAHDELEAVRIRRVRSWRRAGDLCIAPALYREIVQADCDLVHCQGSHTFVPPLAMLAARRAQLPYLVTFHTGGHSSGLRKALRGLQWRAQRPLYAGAARLIGVSYFEARLFRRLTGLPSDRFVVIQNGAHMPAVEACPSNASDSALIASVGRLERYKGHHRVLAALPRILEQRPDARLRIVGSGPYEPTLRSMASRMGLERKVEIGPVPPGDRKAMACLLSRSSLVTLLSEYEAHPVAVMEALALHRQVLVADTSGLRELAERGLVDAIPLDSPPERVAAAVLERLRHPRPAPVVKLPTWDDCADELVALYRNTVRMPRCAS
jgi:glycosyltransferase involved in cell wall biosynthesis